MKIDETLIRKLIWLGRFRPAAQIASQMKDYVTQMTAVNLRFKQLDDVSNLIKEILPAFTILLPTIGV